MLNTPPYMGLIEDPTYTSFFKGFTINQFSPEFGYYGTRTEAFPINGMNVFNVYEGLQVDGLYTKEYFGDVWLQFNQNNWESDFVLTNT